MSKAKEVQRELNRREWEKRIAECESSNMSVREVVRCERNKCKYILRTSIGTEKGYPNEIKPAHLRR